MSVRLLVTGFLSLNPSHPNRLRSLGLFETLMLSFMRFAFPFVTCAVPQPSRTLALALILVRFDILRCVGTVLTSHPSPVPDTCPRRIPSQSGECRDAREAQQKAEQGLKVAVTDGARKRLVSGSHWLTSLRQEKLTRLKHWDVGHFGGMCSQRRAAWAHAQQRLATRVNNMH